MLMQPWRRSIRFSKDELSPRTIQTRRNAITDETVHEICNCYIKVCPPVCGDNPGAPAGGLSTNEAVHKICNCHTTVCPPVRGVIPGALAAGLFTNEAVHKICNSHTTVCPPVRGVNPGA